MVNIVKPIINIWNLLEKNVYVKLRNEDVYLIESIILDNWKTRNTFSRYIGIKITKDNSSILRSLSRRKYFNLDWLYKILLVLSKYDNNLSIKKIQRRLIGIKSSKKGKPILYPRFPIDFNCEEGGILLGALIGDGGLCERDLNFTYYNTKKNLLGRVENSFKKLVGIVNLSRGKINEINYPKVFGLILIYLGFAPGRKTVKNQKIPSFVYYLSFNFKKGFISQIIADEGYVYLSKSKIHSSMIAVNFTIDLSNLPNNIRERNRKIKKHIPETLLAFIRELKSLNVNIRGPYFLRFHKYPNGRYTEEWNSCIFDLKSLKFISENIKIPLDYKQRTLEKIIMKKSVVRIRKT